MRSALLLLVLASCVRTPLIAGEVRGLPGEVITLTAPGTARSQTMRLSSDARFSFSDAGTSAWLLSLSDDQVSGATFSTPQRPVFDLLVHAGTSAIIVGPAAFGELELAAPLEPDGAEGEFVYAFDERRGFSYSGATGLFPAPPGRLRVRAWLTAPEEHCEIFETTVRAGARVRLELRPDAGNPRCD